MKLCMKLKRKLISLSKLLQKCVSMTIRNLKNKITKKEKVVSHGFKSPIVKESCDDIENISVSKHITTSVIKTVQIVNHKADTKENDEWITIN